MRSFLKHRATRCTAWTIMLALMIQIAPMDALAASMKARQQAGAAAEKKQPDVRKLSSDEMSSIYGSGSRRNRHLCGTMPWHRSLRDVNMCNGNLFKSFTDIQVAPGKGAGLVLQRTYNSNDARIGPFGRGWTHAYEIRMEEAYDVEQESGNLNKVEKTDFFGGKHTFNRDADGLYTPPAYLHCELNSDYMLAMEHGMPVVSGDTEEGMDGTVKEYVQFGNVRLCRFITDRFGNRTELRYADKGGVQRLVQVEDPTGAPDVVGDGRMLTFVWENVGEGSDIAWRVTRVDGPLYSVTYEYYDSPTADGAGGEAYNLKKVHLDPTGLNRTTEYRYTTCDDDTGLLSGIYNLGDESGLAERLTVVEYAYGVLSMEYWGLSGSLWVTQITEPGKVYNGDMAHKVWTISWSYFYSPDNSSYIMHAVMSVPPGEGACPDQAIAVGSYNQSVMPFRGYYPTYGQGFVYHKSYEGETITTFEPIEDGQYRHESTCPDGFDPTQWGMIRPSMTRCYEYGNHGHVLRSWYKGFEGVEETNSYFCEDKYFQKESTTDMAGKTTHFEYGSKDGLVRERGNLLWVLDADDKLTTCTYNTAGQKETELNANGVLTTYGYDTDGNLNQVIQDAGTGHLNRTTSMIYDDVGRVTSRTDPMGRTSTIDYNVLGQPTDATFPAAGNVLGESVHYDYDPNGRLEQVTVSRDDQGSITTAMTYDEGTERVNSVTEVVNVGGVPRTSLITYEYNTAGELVRKVLADGAICDYTYDPCVYAYKAALPKDDPNALCRNLKSITISHAGWEEAKKVEYSSDGYGLLFQAKAYPVSTDVEHYYQTDYLYDLGGTDSFGKSRLRLTSIETNWVDDDLETTTLIRKNLYTLFDSVGNRTNNIISYRDDQGVLHNRTETYGYDNLYRLTSVNYGENSHVQNYTFDAMGNRLTKTDTVTGDETYAYDAANMLTHRNSSTPNYANDLNGNTTSGGGRENTWDSQNRLVQCVYNSVTSSFVYGADGLRRRSTAGGTATDYVLDGQSVVQEGHMSGGNFVADATYLTGLRGPECRIAANGVATWYIFDGLGSVVGEADGSGTVTAVTNLDVYGLVRSQTGTSTSKHKFVGSLGHVSEGETGLIYMKARYMDPALGRFISEDPAKDGENWYGYANSNPVNLVDPDGEVAGPLAALYSGLTAAAGCVLGYLIGYLQTASLIQNEINPRWKPNYWGLVTNVFGTGATGLAIGYAAAALASKHPVAWHVLRVSLGVTGMIAFEVSAIVGALSAAVEYWTSPEASQ